ncbi:hypothetical protein BC831DRAFT_506155 [Entophlyctis helioformis]|nr:hypothetical protein BC831DRAFT_506155 [Entophlyctis helioformis]
MAYQHAWDGGQQRPPLISTAFGSSNGPSAGTYGQQQQQQPHQDYGMPQSPYYQQQPAGGFSNGSNPAGFGRTNTNTNTNTNGSGLSGPPMGDPYSPSYGQPSHFQQQPQQQMPFGFQQQQPLQPMQPMQMPMQPPYQPLPLPQAHSPTLGHHRQPHHQSQPAIHRGHGRDADDSGSSVGDDVCYATDQGGLRGKIRLSKDGKHSFVDLEAPAYGHAGLSASGGAGGSNSMSLSRSLVELAKAEKARLKAEKHAREREVAAAVAAAAAASGSSRHRSSSERRSSPTSTDAFGKLVVKDLKHRAKYHVSDKAMLDEERARYNHLEEAYSKLLTQVQQLQQSHLQDIRNTESRFHTASTTLQKALVLKSEETVGLSNQLTNVQARYERDMRELTKERTLLLSKVEMTEKAWKEADATLQDREKKVAELGRLRKDLAERVATREQELVKYAKALREREGDWMREKETRMKMEVKALKLEETLGERDAAIRQLHDTIERKQAEVDELSKVRSVLNETKREVDDQSRREKNYLAEIEQVTARERKLFNEVEELAAQQRKYVSEISRLNARQSTLLQDAEMSKTIEAQLRQELEQTLGKTAQQAQDLMDLEKQARQFQSDNGRLLRDVSEMQGALHELRADNQAMDKDLSQFRGIIETLKAEKETLLAQRSILEADRDAKHREADDLHAQLNDVGSRLEQEIRTNGEIRQQNKDKLMSVSAKIADLQSTLSDTQLQLQDLRENESVLRQTIRQREETIRGQNATLVEMQSKLADMQGQVTRDQQDYESYKAKKRDEILSIQDRFTHAKTAMEQEIQTLRSQHAAKLAQLTSVADEASKLKVELSELSADRFSLEARVSELLAGEASYQRQVSNLQLAVNQKNQEIARLVAKHQAMVDQMRRLDDEMSAYRNGSMTAGSAMHARDGEIMRLQSNMEEISKRLKSQVDLLLDRDYDGKASGGVGGASTAAVDIAATRAQPRWA